MTHRLCNLIALVCALLLGIELSVAAYAVHPSWTRPIAPFRIAGNLYYVGTEDLASYLVVTPQGNILINSTLEQNVPLIEKNIEALGFHFRDTRILLISHAHYDHCGGSARIKQLTGAQYDVMDGDVSAVESGERSDYQYGHDASMFFKPTRVDRILHDGDTVALGGMILTAHRTAGHTRGTTTWTFDEIEAGTPLHVVIVGGPNLNPNTRLVGNRYYPRIAADFEHGFNVLKALPCDIFLGAHGSYFDLDAKLANFKKGDTRAFTKQDDYRAYIADREKAFQTELKRQSGSAQLNSLSPAMHPAGL